MGNALKRHGAIICSSDHRYLTHADGTPFFWLADTWWFAATNRMTTVMLKTLITDRVKKGFSVIQLVVGPPPEVAPFSPEAENSGGYPFTKKNTINPKYFDNVNPVIDAIVAAGLVPCIVGSWGHHIDRFGVETMKLLWREIITRWGAMPVVFCLTGEADVSLKGSVLQTATNSAKWKKLLRFINVRKTAKKFFSVAVSDESKEIHNLLTKRVKKWDEVARYIKEIDKNHHLLTVHPHRKLLASELFHHPDWLDIDTIQSGHTMHNAAFIVSSAMKASAGTRPFINAEPWYEGILGNFGPTLQRYAFWMSVLSGAKGHTYGAHGVWQMAQDDNFMEHWGDSDWKTAMNYQGSTQLGKAKQFLEKYPWWTFTAYPSTVTPSWNEDNPFRPMAAIDCDSRLWVYCSAVGVKDKHTYQIQLPESYKWAIATLIDPSSLRCIKKQRIAKSFSLTAYATVDRLLLLEPGV